MKNAKFLILSLAVSSISLVAQAQEADMLPQEETIIPVMSNLPQFFICLLSGVLLAMGFQLFLTTLSVASGISLMGNLNKDDRNPTDHSASDARDENKDTVRPKIFKITRSFGIFTVLTASISLFFASLLAVKLSLVEDDYIGITLGLVIWATFFSLMTYFEVKSVSTLVGGIFNTALYGLRSSMGALRGIFSGTSEVDKTKNLAQSTVTAIKDELTHTLDDLDIREKVEDYLERLRPPSLNYNKIKRDVADLLESLVIQEQTAMGPAGPEKRIFLRLASEHGHFSRRDLDELSRSFDDYLPEHERGRHHDEERERMIRDKVERYFYEIGAERLTLDNLKQDLYQIFDDPKVTREIMLRRMDQLTRNGVVKMLAQRKGLTPQDVERAADLVEKALLIVKDKMGSVQAQTPTGEQGMTDRIRGAAMDMKQDVKDKGSEIQGKVEMALKGYLDNLNRPELNFDKIKRDFERILHDPKATYQVLKARLSQIDRNTMIALLSSRENISRVDAERMVDKIEEARDNVLRKAEEMENTLKAKADEAKREAIYQAENVRQGAMSASWWLFVTALFSGVAAAMGGLLA